MNPFAPLLRLHQHRVWVNARVLDAAEQLSESQLHLPHNIGQGSIWLTLTHLFAAEYIWLEALEGNDRPCAPGDDPAALPGNQKGDKKIVSLVELRSRWSELDRRWKTYLASLEESSLDDRVFKWSSNSGEPKRYATSRLDVLLHVCTHSQYTVAQAVNMMRRVGLAALPDSMLITMAREEPTGEELPRDSSD